MKGLIKTPAYVLGRVPYRESDLIVHLLTERLGKVPALARGARRSQKRFGGALEPVHSLDVELEERTRGEFFLLKGASLARVRVCLTGDLDALEAAGKALNWVRRSAPAHTPEEAVFQSLTRFLDELDAGALGSSSGRHLAAFGLRLLDTLGWGLSLKRCVSCGKLCPEESSALLNPERGGLVCRACGGAAFKVTSTTRNSLSQAAAGRLHALDDDDAALAQRIVERVLGAHMGIE